MCRWKTAGMRHRVAALIQREGRLLVVRQRSRGARGRHDGPAYLTPPGGGIEQGETPAQAVTREVREEVGLTVLRAQHVADIAEPGGTTAVFTATVAVGDPTLGVDPELDCTCPRMVGLEWVPAPELDAWRGPDARSLLRMER